MVLAADTEESWGSELKIAASKIIIADRVLGQSSSGMCITGAGDGHYLDTIKMEIFDEVYSSPEWTYEGTGKLLEAKLKRFYKAHVIPFLSDPAGSPEFELLIGLNMGRVGASSVGSAWATAKNTIRPIIGYEAIGVGAGYAKALLSRLYSSPMEIKSTCAMAVHIISCVKHLVPLCGKQTQLVALVEGKARYAKQGGVDQLEKVMERYLLSESRVFRSVISSGGDELPNLIRDLESLRSEIEAINLFDEPD